MYIPHKPEIPEMQVVDIPITALGEYVDWRFLFSAWKITGHYPGIERMCTCASCQAEWLRNFSLSEQPKAREALSLLMDAQDLLRRVRDKKLLNIKGVATVYPAVSQNEGILFKPAKDKSVYLPMLRQQERNDDNVYLSLADFVSPKSDYVGVFAVSVHGTEELSRKFSDENDVYNSILIKSVADRLAEAAAEWLHERIRKINWGFAKDETISVKEMLQSKFQGIRPAIGYPSIPDQSIIFDLDKILPLNSVGISLTENGAMIPNSSVCGLIIANPDARYFMVGRVGEDQLDSYARRRGFSIKEMKRWLSPSIDF